MMFLLQYDREAGRLLSFRSFPEGDAAAAQQARLELELSLNRRGILHEVVVLDAANEDDLRRTHRRYFAGASELASAAEVGEK